MVTPDTRERAPAALHPAVAAAVEQRLLEERTRWAMQVHDGLTQAVTSAVLELQTLRERIRRDPAGAIATLEEVEREIREDLHVIRQILFEMTAEEPPTAPAFARFVHELAERWHLPSRVAVDTGLDDVAAETLHAAEAIVAEAFANAAKHSGAPEVAVTASVEQERLRVIIEDHGRGIAALADDEPHFGLQIMRTRAESVGGSLDVESTPGHGTRVRAVLPVGGRGERG